MPLVGKIQIKASKDMKAGEQTTLGQLFSISQLKNRFPVETEVILGKSKLTLKINKLEAVNGIAESNKKPGDIGALWFLMKASSLGITRAKVVDSIKKGEELAATLST